MDEKKKIRIAVLMGGYSAERDVSLATGAGVIKGLRDAGYNAIGIDTAMGASQLSENKIKELSKIEENPPSNTDLSELDASATIQTVSSPDLKNVDMVFIALHGGMGENGTIQALLDIVGIPYTGSGVLASAVAMDKVAAKRIVSAAGVPTPDYFVKASSEINDMDELVKAIENTIGFPLVIKPNDQGSSVGLNIAMRPSELEKYVKQAKEYSDRVLFEKMIEGRELTVSILGNEALPVAEVIPKGGFYDYQHKYTPGLADKIVPAPLSEDETAEVQKLGLIAFRALNCRGYARIDFRYSKDKKWYFLEANTLPGMTRTSLVPKAAKAAGIEFPGLLERIVRIALDDFKRGKKR
ncbi:MAG: D-alanine--D-alanine ligase [Candidatus Zixiibacteriota bacterium]|nr:MAG: D-alanine--D-alanine ligase [candidate division Zixibacteria bacterium]